MYKLYAALGGCSVIAAGCLCRAKVNVREMEMICPEAAIGEVDL